MMIQGTRTEMNLRKAFEAESKAAMRYFHFAEEASDDGYIGVGKIFKEAMFNESEHAEEFLEHLGGISDTVENLKRSIAFESFETAVDYPEMAKVARQEGFEEIAKKFELVGAIEKYHKERFEKILRLIENGEMYSRKTKQKWECMKCGHVHEGLEPPEECPFCGHKKEYFKIKCEDY